MPTSLGIEKQVPEGAAYEVDDDPDCIEAAKQFLQFCRKAWSDIESNASTSSMKAELGNVHCEDHVWPAVIPASASRSGHTQRPLLPKPSKEQQEQTEYVVPPPGYLVSNRQPKPGEPPVWGMFMKPQEPLLSSPLQRPSKTTFITQSTASSTSSASGATIHGQSNPFR